MNISQERLNELIHYIISGNELAFYSSKEWKALRQLARDRDNQECQDCKATGKVFTANDSDKRKKLEVDHIKELKDYPELCLELSNLRTLCVRCHNKKHNRYQYKEPKWNDERW